jgi:hypothetical protein
MRAIYPFPASPTNPPSLASRLRVAALLLAALGSGVVSAHGGATVFPHRVAALEVRGELPPPRAGVTSLKFGEFFRMPIGAFGLEPSEKLLALNGKPVRLVGYMVREETPVPGRFLFAPLPVALGDEDESLSDDLPPTTVSVHLTGAKNKSAPYIGGLIQLGGTLEVGTRDEADARLSAVRLILEPRMAQAILRAKPVLRASTK